MRTWYHDFVMHPEVDRPLWWRYGLGRGQVMGPYLASEWAEYRGNHRLCGMIRHHRLLNGDRLVKTNVTPFSI